jgi:lipoyl-dependent peroxiredoxin
MEDYEGGLADQGVPEPSPPPGGELLDSVVRPALVAATRLFLVAGVALVLVDEAGGLQAAVAAGDLAQALEEVAPQLWSGPSVEVLASGAAVRTTSLPGEARWPALAGRPELAGVNSLLCVPVEGAAGPAGTLTAVRRPDRPWQAQEVEALLTYAGVVASLVAAAAESERTTQIIDQLEHALHHRVVIEQAKGILMEREQLDAAGAFDRLRKAARARRRRVSEVAAEVVAGQALPFERQWWQPSGMMPKGGPTPRRQEGPMEVLYTAEATATGGRKNGRAYSSDGAIDVQINPPKEVGGSGEGTNPEQLFAAGYAACFDNALATVARMEKLDPGQTSVTALVALAKHPEGGFALDVELRVTVPNLTADEAESLVAKAHRRCPYSRATRGNVDVRLTVL